MHRTGELVRCRDRVYWVVWHEAADRQNFGLSGGVVRVRRLHVLDFSSLRLDSVDPEHAETLLSAPRCPDSIPEEWT